MNDQVYFVCENRAENRLWVAGPFDRDELWSNVNPNGITFQQIAGDHGVIREEHTTKTLAYKALKTYQISRRATAREIK